MTRTKITAIITATILVVGSLYIGSNVLAPVEAAQATEMVLLQCFNVGNLANDIEVRGQSSSSGITAPPARFDNCAQALSDLQGSGLEIIDISGEFGTTYTLSNNP